MSFRALFLLPKFENERGDIMEQVKRTYVCKRLRLCRYLIDRGFSPYKIAPDRDNPKYNVYLFEQTTGLSAAVLDYFTKTI